MDVSKYIAFTDCKTFSWNHLLDPDRLKRYITHLQKNGIGPDGVFTKLDRVQAAIKYLMRDVVQYRKCDKEGKIIMAIVENVEKITHIKDRAVREKDTYYEQRSENNAGPCAFYSSI